MVGKTIVSQFLNT